MTGYDEERIAGLLRLLPAPPDSWVTAAQQLPRARAEIDEIVARRARGRSRNRTGGRGVRGDSLRRRCGAAPARRGLTAPEPARYGAIGENGPRWRRRRPSSI